MIPPAIVTPPFRTPLLTQNGTPFAGDNNDIQTTRDWWLYWQQLTGQGNASSRLAGQGTHADRPMPDGMPDGALYVESDRGVIYSNEGGVWQYVAGTMYGTLSPDQRPDGLDVNDAGFDFRGTDAPREFIWSGTAWVEVTAVQYGTHAARPDPATIVEGALYVESDRGGVIYQRETPSGTPLWQYLAGTMWGTLVPDQRPTGLGTHDAGFDFRTTTAPPREFIWNQTAWVEVTPVTGAIGLTHPNVVTKVDTTTGQIVEGGITDLSAANSGKLYITAAGLLGVATAGPQCILDFGSAGIVPNRNLLIGLYTSGNVWGGIGMDPAGIGVRIAGDFGANTLADFGNYSVDSSHTWVSRFLVYGQGNVRIASLPSANPGVGSKQIWYDPADGNRVKYAP